MSDPLLVLRDAILQNPECPLVSFLDSSGEVIQELAEAEYIRLGTSGSTFPRQCLTNFKSKRGSGPFYTLDAVVFVLKHRDDSFSVYLQESRKKGLPVVSLVDKKDLVDYLTTPGADSQYVDHREPLPVPIKGFKKVRKVGDESASVASAATSSGLNRQIRTRKHDYVSDVSFAFLHPAIKLALGIKDVAEKTKQSTTDRSKATSNPLKTKKSLIDQISSINKTQLPSTNLDGSRGSGKEASDGIPIILVPNAPSSLITLFNVKEWLERSSFVLPADAKAAATAKQSSVTVSHQFENDSQPMSFMVIDSPASLSPHDWRRVVAAVVLGNTWQFKGWKWSAPADIFSNIAGFYVQWDDVHTDSIVSQWNVKRINISRNKRHLDSTAVIEFWHHLGLRIKSSRQ